MTCDACGESCHCITLDLHGSDVDLCDGCYGETTHPEEVT